MQQLDKDIVYCCDAQCQEPIKIIQSVIEHCVKHNSHKTKLISQLKNELTQLYDQADHLKIPLANDKEDIILYIDKGIIDITSLFSQTMFEFSTKLKLYVNNNLVSLRNIQQLYKAVIESNKDQIYLHQSGIEFLDKDPSYFNNQFQISKDISTQVKQIIESTKLVILDINKQSILQTLPSSPQATGFIWSSLNKNQSIIIDDKIVKSVDPLRQCTILLEPKLTLQQIRKIQIKLKNHDANFQICNIQICDLNIVRLKSPDLYNIHKQGSGAYSHNSIGQICGAAPYEIKKQMRSFLFTVGETLELQWNGPSKTFSTVKMSTGERFEFKVNYDDDAEIYFGVSMCGKTSFELT